MLPSERQGDILERINGAGYAKATDLQEIFGVSHMTIQRDLRDLEHRGLIKRVRGGAASLDTRDLGYGLRERINRLEKEAIGRAAAALVQNGQSVFVDAGTTALEVARHLVKRSIKLNLVTSSVKVSAEISGQPMLQVRQLGGDIYAQSFGVIGPEVVKALGHLNLDWAFLSTAGVDAKTGLTNNNHLEVAVKQAAMLSSRRVVFLADSSKLSLTKLVQITPLNTPHTLVTTKQLPSGEQKKFEKLGWEVIIAN